MRIANKFSLHNSRLGQLLSAAEAVQNSVPLPFFITPYPRLPVPFILLSLALVPLLSARHHLLIPAFSSPCRPPFPRPSPLAPLPSLLVPRPSPIFYPCLSTILCHPPFPRPRPLAPCPSPSSYPCLLVPRSQSVTLFLSLSPRPSASFFPSPLVPLLPVRHPSFIPAFLVPLPSSFPSPITPRSPSVTIFLSLPSRPSATILSLSTPSLQINDILHPDLPPPLRTNNATGRKCC